MQALDAERQGALAAGLDRIDSRVPLFDELPGLLAEVMAVLARRRGRLSRARRRLGVMTATVA